MVQFLVVWRWFLAGGVLGLRRARVLFLCGFLDFVAVGFLVRECDFWSEAWRFLDF